MFSKVLKRIRKGFSVESFRENWPVFLLFIISVILCLRNYTPGTFLSGWDTLHPEFNFGLAFERAFFGVFRVEQGLGAVAGHSHMADLPRIIILYLAHFILPLSFLRYFYIFLNLVAGTLGMYLLLKKHFVKQKIPSFLGALFYLLNIGTVQIFNVPFEMFTTLFATLPFIFYFAISYMGEAQHRSRNLLLFALLAILNTPSAYAATLWYIFFGSFFIYFLAFSIVNFNKDIKIFRRFLHLILVFLAVNFYWLLPNIYFILNHGAEVAHANVNRLFSDQAFLKNKEFGNIKDILLLKSFYFDWSVYKGNGAFTDLLLPWINHLRDGPVVILGFLFSLSFIAGAFVCLKKFRLKSLPLFSILLVSLFFLINDNLPVSPIYDFLQNHIPFFKEAFRFPDDKILNLYIFIVSIFFGFFSLLAIEFIQKIKIKIKNKEFIFAGATAILILYYMLPAFSGNFVNSFMRIDIPKDYFNLFSYLKNEPDSIRVANLPIQSPWGWVYYDWDQSTPSYQGAGFLYFGIKQPLLDRDFDRWSPYNESYYREMSYAIYTQNAKLLVNVINKYKIGVVFLDGNVIDPQNQKSILYLDEAKRLLTQTGLVTDHRIFDKIDVFRLNNDESKISAINSNINVSPKTFTTYEDLAYENFGNYITGNSDNLSKVYYPFRDLIDNQSKLHKNLFKIDNEKITLIPSSSVNNFSTENLSEEINLIPSDLIAKKEKDQLNLSIYPNTPVFDQTQSAGTLKTTIDIAGKKNVSISVNRNEFFSLGSLPQNFPLAIGKIILNNNQDNIISAFDTSLLKAIPEGLLSVNPLFSSCNGQNSPISGFTQNGVTIEGIGDICIIIPYKFISQLDFGKSENILTSLKFNLDSHASIDSCLLDLVSLNCIHYNQTQRSGSLVSLSSVISPTQINSTAIKVFIKPGNSLENTFNLENANFFYTPSFSDSLFSSSDIKKIFLSKSNISFDKLYLSKNVIYDPGFEITKINNFNNNCPTGSNAIKEIVTVDGTSSIRYYSESGSYCDHFSYPNLPHNQGYLIGVYSKNKQGLPLTVCISNDKTAKCDIYSDLTSYKSMDKDIFLLPPINDGGVGYNINFENIGINKSPSENFVSSIEIIPIPYEFLVNLKSESKTNELFNGNIKEVKKINPLSYVVSTQGTTVLSFFYSFENGFKAYKISCSGSFSCLIKSTLAPFYATELKQHVLVNNWANGWIVDKSDTAADNSKIAIVFVPQYLEYFGLILILITLLSIGMGRKPRK